MVGDMTTSSGAQQLQECHTFEHDPATAMIISAAIEVHKALGPGLLESVYQECLCHEFGLRGISHERQVCIPIAYKGLAVSAAYYRLDILVEGQIIPR
jgi:GxxExxY protein